jgi:hypothetical protein
MTISNGAVLLGFTIGAAGLGWIWGKCGNFFSRLMFETNEAFFFFLVVLITAAGVLARAFPRPYWLGIPIMAYALAYLLQAIPLQKTGEYWFRRADPLVKGWHKKYLSRDAFIKGQWLHWSPKVAKVLDWLTWTDKALEKQDEALSRQIETERTRRERRQLLDTRISALLMKARVFLAMHQNEVAKEIILTNLPPFLEKLSKVAREATKAQMSALLSFSHLLDGQPEEAERLLRVSRAVVSELRVKAEQVSEF